ncbi:MAG: hypothetical protein WCI39_06225 [Gallionellaceae bacterium]
MSSKQKMFPILGLLSGAMVWGVIWDSCKRFTRKLKSGNCLFYKALQSIEQKQNGRIWTKKDAF